jgi:hypothetical protein
LENAELVYDDVIIRPEDDIVRHRYDPLAPPTEESVQPHHEDMLRQHHGILAIAKILSQPDTFSTPGYDMGFCIRHDAVIDKRERTDFTEENEWSETTLKFSSNLKGGTDFLRYHGFFNYGKNVKFPSMLQQVSATFFRSNADSLTKLDVEYSNGFDLGIELSGLTPDDYPSYLSGWELTAYLFKNFYKNRLRESYTPGLPITFYDNVKTADISGFEANASLYMADKKIVAGLGFSGYNIPDKAAFPFKYDKKFTADLKLNHAGYNFQFLFYYEGAQVGWVRDFSGGFEEVDLAGYTDIDLHLKKTFEIYKFRLLFNFSVRNMLNNDVQLVGLAIRDRRYYITIGAEL